MKDLLKDIIESSRDRIKTPITGSYTIAFLIYNWRPILFLLFSEASIEDKIVVINAEYCFWGAVLWPLVIALLYVLVVPYLMMTLEGYTKKAVEGRKTNKSEQRLFDLKILKEISQEEFEIEKIKTGQKEISELNEKIISLNTHIDNLNTQQKSEIKNNEELIEGYKKNEDNFKETIENLSRVSSLQKEQWEKLKKLLDIDDLINKLSDEDKKTFIDFCDFYFHRQRSSLSTNGEEIENYKNLLFITEPEVKQYTLTPIGSEAYKKIKLIMDFIE